METDQSTNQSPATDSPAVAGCPAPLCSDCGKNPAIPDTIYMHVQVHGLFVRLCSDCLEEANLEQEIYAEPCPRCHGSGTEWEGWDCEYCDGTGTFDY